MHLILGSVITLFLSTLLFVPTCWGDDKKKPSAPKLIPITEGAGEVEYIDLENGKIRLKIKDIKWEEHWVSIPNAGYGRVPGSQSGYRETRPREETQHKDYNLAPNFEVFIQGVPVNKSASKAPATKSKTDDKKDGEKKEASEGKKSDEMKDEKNKEGSKTGQKTASKSTSSSSSNRKTSQPKLDWIPGKTDMVVKGQLIHAVVARSSDRNDSQNYITKIYVLPISTGK